MTYYVLNYAGSGAVSEIVADSDMEAARIALDLIGGDAVAADQWDADGQNDDEEPMERLLIWACEEDSRDDPGAKAIAQLTVVRGGK
jgi:hypothetical protein